MADSEIAPDKVAAYFATLYRVGTGAESFTLRIGQYSPELARLYVSSDRNCGLFITAFNPFGQAQSEAANEAAHRLLGKDLRTISACVVEGEGADLNGLWPPEKSYLALGIDHEAACILGKRWSQDAVVWTGEEATPKLILLR
ncbi:DUF3293 domain-containing protein [Rhodoblastus sp. 17X3]|uniref:DUF3293 domain-containing protein n=1 Tax=Rhodoblastus sp. 17X3 TaxID=3047026 RepID=UPI0024B7A1E0|nr:DUF3293 domain-containing protein [Rhodoblastus sp. 17X3]MDI9849530.1 DUF3293 domain-containing protein [Rhodoblastus sp. 17X3]